MSADTAEWLAHASLCTQKRGMCAAGLTHSIRAPQPPDEPEPIELTRLVFSSDELNEGVFFKTSSAFGHGLSVVENPSSVSSTSMTRVSAARTTAGQIDEVGQEAQRSAARGIFPPGDRRTAAIQNRARKTHPGCPSRLVTTRGRETWRQKRQKGAQSSSKGGAYSRHRTGTDASFPT